MKKAVNEYAEVETIGGFQLITIDGVCIPKIVKTIIEQEADCQDGMCCVTVSFLAKLKDTIPTSFEIKGEDLIGIINKRPNSNTSL